MIKALRVDDRLLHGQVAVSWVSFLGVDTIVIANDELIKNDTMQVAFKLAKPPGVILSMKSLQGAVNVLNNPKHESKKILVITGSVQDAEFVCKNTKGIKHVIVGGLRDGKSKKKVSITVYLDDKDMDSLAEIAALGTEITLQAVPTSQKLTYKDIQNEFKK